MPHSTVNYPFEYKVLEAISSLSMNLQGRLTTFLLIFDQSGGICKISFEREESTWFDEVDRLRTEQIPHLFFDPLDVPNHIWLSWLGVHKVSIERLINASFQDEDFCSLDQKTDKKISNFPSIWETVFDLPS